MSTRPHPAFELQMPELAAEDFDYAILRRPADGARKDMLSLGHSGRQRALHDGRNLPRRVSRASLHRRAEARSRRASSPITVIDDVKPAGSIDSKFGDGAVGRFRHLSAGKPNGKARRCLGFARSFAKPVDADRRLVLQRRRGGGGSRRRSACALDRLTMLSAGGDAKLAGCSPMPRSSARSAASAARSWRRRPSARRSSPGAAQRKTHSVRLRGHLLAAVMQLRYFGPLTAVR